MKKLSLLPRLLLVLLLLLPAFHACRTTSGEPQQNEEEKEEILPNDAVMADGILETVTWNIEWYGHTSKGPGDEHRQTKNVLQITDSLQADLYAFQEIYNQEALNKIASHMPGYHGFTADYISYNQRMAFLFNTNTIDSLSSGTITKEDVRAAYRDSWQYYWAGERSPLYFEFSYNDRGTEYDFFAVTIHGKANTGENAAEYEEAYQRRKKAAEGLYYYLQDNHPDANIILLGDYNDDVDQSIFYYEKGNYAQTPYALFVNNTQDFEVLTKVLSDAGKSASVNYSNLIDHITISNELFNTHINNSTKVYKAPQSFIMNYGRSTSDHLPVWAKFDLSKSKAGGVSLP